LKKVILFVLLAIVSNFLEAQTVSISGVASLVNESDHAGIEVEFTRTAPAPVVKVFTTNSAGEFDGALQAGIYNVVYRKAGYFSKYMYDVQCFASPSLTSQVLHFRETQIHIPDIFGSIQQAIDDANTGDTIVVHPGVYEENIDFKGKSLVLTSLFMFSQDTADISATILDGKHEKSVIVCGSGENEKTRITGLTIQHGLAEGGYPDWFGGGIRISDSSPTLDYLIIKDNHASIGGGGIYLHHSSSKITNVVVMGNTTDNDGGGIRITSSFVAIKNAIIANNLATSRGGGIACTLFDYIGRAEIINCTIVNNSVIEKSPDNQFSGGAGVKAYGHNLEVKNSIVAFNVGDYGISYYNFNGSENYPYISYSLFHSNANGDFYECNTLCGPVVTQNINGTPVDAFFNVYQNPGFKKGDSRYSLYTSSAAVDAGYNDFVDLTTDIQLAPRIQNNKGLEESYVNIGATESVSDGTIDDDHGEVTDVKDEIPVSIYSVYPNPMKGQLTVENNELSSRFNFSLVNVSGNVMTVGKNSTKHTVSVDHLPSGIYFVIIQPTSPSEKQKVYRVVKTVH